MSREESKEEMKDKRRVRSVERGEIMKESLFNCRS